MSVKPTSVICVRGIDPRQDPEFVYVGRAVPRARWNVSPWGNPFLIGQRWDKAAEFLTSPDREHMLTLTVRETAEYLRRHPDRLLTGHESITFFSVYLNAHPELCGQLPSIRGRKLGCWCVDYDGGPQLPNVPCHAVVLALRAHGRHDDLGRYMTAVSGVNQRCLKP